MSDLYASFLPDSIIKRLSLRARELGAINLGQGIPSFPTPAHIIEAAKVALDDPIIGVYPNFLGEEKLRSVIVEKLNKEQNVNLTGKNDTLVTVGAMEATASVILGLVGNGDRVGIITPDYCNHMPQVALARGELMEIPMKVVDVSDSRNVPGVAYSHSENQSRVDSGNVMRVTESHSRNQFRWEIDLEKVESEMKNGMKLLILTNPSNPMGAVATRETLKKLITLAQKYHVWLLSDETYNFATFETPFTSALEFWDTYEQILVVRSFSKEYAMTGWRVGYLIARPEAMGTFTKVHDALVGTAPKISQRAAIAAITGPQDCVSEYRNTFLKRRDIACKLIDAAKGSGLSYAKPQGAYYLFLKYSKPISSVEMSEKLLTEAKVAVVPGSAFGSGGEGHVRISYAVDDQILVDGITRLTKYFKRLHKST